VHQQDNAQLIKEAEQQNVRRPAQFHRLLVYTSRFSRKTALFPKGRFTGKGLVGTGFHQTLPFPITDKPCGRTRRHSRIQRHVDEVGRGGAGHVAPVGVEPGRQRIGLHLQAPADMVGRPGQGELLPSHRGDVRGAGVDGRDDAQHAAGQRADVPEQSAAGAAGRSPQTRCCPSCSVQLMHRRRQGGAVSELQCAAILTVVMLVITSSG